MESECGWPGDTGDTAKAKMPEQDDQSLDKHRYKHKNMHVESMDQQGVGDLQERKLEGNRSAQVAKLGTRERLRQASICVWVSE